ncbi:MAG: saccharopine dehydrogenase [Hydrocarboniphaga sp.]|uniref:saccharopine dehydrogenase family protein n=1 Tax=Hydrocarboniphaga sp. TaxID=2033016 RepID=UPI00260BFD6C|nr:saccharopine dehydrogenase NADP-binding domain-containing protein [Hydrocarboniphaga sp.]MDB5970917.1 saccharopine dehydrogenase [Hydrocarboniphaga sp.]
MTRTKPEFDIVLFGASGYTGKLVAQYLAQRGGKPFSWALAGRDRRKLEKLRDSLSRLDPRLDHIPLIEANSRDPEAMQRLARSARVVISAVGPYIHLGEPLVAACAEAGTDYVDLSGEPEFVDQMWLRYHDQARASGAHIVNCCGFDSVPHDLGAFFTVRQLPEGVPVRLEGFVRAGGKMSGGTLSTAVTAMSRWRQMQSTRKERRRVEGRPVDRRIGTTHGRLRYDRQLHSWVVPMPTIDAQVVLRSAACDERYGSEFRYGHYLQMKNLPMMAAIGGGLGALALASQVGVVRKRIVALSGKGVGPTQAERDEGWFSVRFIGTGGGKTVYTEVSGGDPGYGESAKMLAESALCLAFDRLPRRPGVQTPAHVLGQPLIHRLQTAGIGFNVLDSLNGSRRAPSPTAQ